MKKKVLVAVVGLSDWIGNGIEQVAGVHREERVRPATTFLCIRFQLGNLALQSGSLSCCGEPVRHTQRLTRLPFERKLAE